MDLVVLAGLLGIELLNISSTLATMGRTISLFLPTDLPKTTTSPLCTCTKVSVGIGLEVRSVGRRMCVPWWDEVSVT